MSLKLKEKFKKDIIYSLLVISFLIYFTILVWAIIFKFSLPALVDGPGKHSTLQMTLTDRFIYGFRFQTREVSRTWYDFIINIVFFLPLGMYFPLIFKKYNFVRDVLIGMLISTTFEIVEALTRMGCFDIIDILSNTSGVILGSFIYYIVRPKVHFKGINYFQLGIIIFCLPVVIYAITIMSLQWNNLYSKFFDFITNPYLI